MSDMILMERGLRALVTTLGRDGSKRFIENLIQSPDEYSSWNEGSQEMLEVLIIDDASIMRFVLKDILSEFSNVRSVREAANGTEGIRKYKTLRPDIVFLDINMPDLDGIAVVKEIVSIDPAANIIMCTSSNDEKDVVECIKAGAVDFMIKPVSSERVMRAIEKISFKL